MQYSFDHPADWTVEETASGAEPGSGTVTVTDPDGQQLASLDILIAWGAVCPCEDYPAAYLGDFAGEKPLSLSGPFAARSMAVDLSEHPSERAVNDWPENVRVVTSLTPAATPPPSTMVPSLMYGIGQVETGVMADNGTTQRTVLFMSNRDFETLDDARAYAASEEHRNVQAMIASFRER